MANFWQGQDVYVQDLLGRRRSRSTRLPVRVVTQLAWHSLFGRQLFIRPNPADSQLPEFTILFAPEFQADPAERGHQLRDLHRHQFQKARGADLRHQLCRRDEEVGVHHHELPAAGPRRLPDALLGERRDRRATWRCSSASPAPAKPRSRPTRQRRLIGDDEHGWSDHGVFNFEGGCYAKCIRLSRGERAADLERDPLRHGARKRRDGRADARLLDFDSDEITENTRAAYPLDFIDNAVMPSVGGHPANVIFLTADAFGVLPPISRLTPEQAMYHFLSGYTAKVAGTERGLGKEPQATFSACFGAPFLPRPAGRLCLAARRKAATHQAACWLVNTGWAGGPYGVGARMKLPYTRAMLNAALSGELSGVATQPHPSSKSRSRTRAPASPRSSSMPAACGPTRPPTTAPPAISAAVSTKISQSSPESRQKSPPPRQHCSLSELRI